ncbi:Rho GTPase activation protein, partial [Ramicandelaber brevisporus]
IPIIVQKCSWRLIESATHASGIFRVNGALRRVAELQSIFDSPPSYGRDVNWDGFKHHDVATLLRRYLTTLPDPVIPPNMYHQFLELYDDCVASYCVAPSPEIIALRESTCSRFGALIASLVPAERDLLLSILSLLHYFSGFRSQTMMDTDNLAAIFQPGLLVHPDYVLNPDEYTRAKAVVAFLI